MLGYTLLVNKVGESTFIQISSPTPSWTVSGLLPNTMYSIGVVTNCADALVSQPATTGNVTTKPIVSVYMVSNSSSGGLRTQVIKYGIEPVQAGYKFVARIYDHPVEIIAGYGFTDADIVAQLRDAINATTEAQWNSAGNAPASGTIGFKPVATSSGNLLTVELNDSGFVYFGVTF